MFTSSKEESNIYVSVNGEDNNPGTLERPFASIERARIEAGKLKKTGSNSINIYLREGTYYLEKPLVLQPDDSGSEIQAIRYMSYGGEKPVLSGGKRITGEWKPYADGIMMCKIPEEKNGKLDFTQLFINGKRQIRARYPNYDPSEPGKSGYIYPAEAELKWPHKEFRYDLKTFTKRKWAKPQEAVVHIFGMNYWGNLQWEIEDIDRDTQTIKLGRGGFQINEVMQGRDATGIDHRSGFYIENVFEELDSPGEWYLDKENGILYVVPEEGIDLNTAIIEAPVLKQVVEFRGSQEAPVHNIYFSGFRIAHTASTYFEEYEAPSLGDWTIHRGGAVFFGGAEDCSFENCYFDGVGGNAIFVNNYNRRINISGNTITEAGDSGICIAGSKHLTLGSNRKYPAEITISNNLIHDIGIFGKQTAGVFVSISEDNIISHNHMYNLPRAAICINDGTWGGHVIEFNDIHDTVRETCDHGPFNSWGRERFWCLQQSHGPVSHEAGEVRLDCRKPVIIRNNRFEDYKGWGIDLDDGSSNYQVYNNLCIGIGIKLREGDYRLIENNIFINAANPPGFHIGYEYNHDRFVRNIVVMNSKFDTPEVDINFEKGKSAGKLYEIIGPPSQGPWLEEIDNNLFFSDIGQFKAAVHFRPIDNKCEDFTFEEWKAMRLDKNSIYADPLFVDAEKGNYSLKSESPAFKIGFVEFDMDSYGLIDEGRCSKPAIWVAPFIAEKNSDLFKSHPD
jgi:hypothetical protein